MSKVLQICLVSMLLLVNNGHSANHLSQINSTLSVETLNEYTSLFKEMRKYIANCNGLKDSDKTISQEEAFNKYNFLSKIINLANNSNYTFYDISKIINNIYDQISNIDLTKTGMGNPIFSKGIAPKDFYKELNQQDFKDNFFVLLEVIVSSLLREQCAFISEYSPSNKQNEDVVNLFIIAWHVIIKFAYEHSKQDLANKLLEFFNSDKNCSIRIECNLINIPELNNNKNNSMGNNMNNINNSSNNMNQFNNNMQNNIRMSNMSMQNNTNCSTPNNINNNHFNNNNNISMNNMRMNNMGMNNMHMPNNMSMQNNMQINMNNMNMHNMGKFNTNNNFRNNNMNNF